MNKFDRSNYPKCEPKTLRAGDFWSWRRADLASTYQPEQHVLTYWLYSLENGEDIEISATSVDGDFVVEESSMDSASGAYKWVAKITEASSGRSVTVDEGFLRVEPSGGDQRSHTLKVLQAIRATIEKTATKEQVSYSVAGRSLSRRTPQELIDLEREYAQRWSNEKRTLDRKNGRKPKSRLTRVTF